MAGHDAQADRGRPPSRRAASWRRRTVLWLGLAVGLAGPACAATAPGGAAPGGAVTVFAAASLTDAMKTLARLWVSQGHATPLLSFASSSVLAQQVAQGAPADLFVSADEKWMDWLAARKLVRTGTRTVLLGNTLVLVEQKDGLKPVTIGSGLDMNGVLGAAGRLAVGDPASVPAGIYAKQALTRLGLWNAVSGRLAPAENVRAALLLVERGEAPAGVVYGSDVLASPGLGVAGTFPEGSHEPIRYPAAVLTGSADPAAASAFLAFLRTQAAAELFRKAGFVTVDAR